jgi:hypothetical protein
LSAVDHQHEGDLAVAALASLASTATSHAQVYGGFTIAAGTPRIVSVVNQNATPATNATSYLTVQRCSGVLQYPALVVTSATTCTAVGPDYQITMTVLSATQTAVKIVATAPTCAIKSVSFGTPNSQCGYDLTNPNPGTAGSLTGANPVPIAGSLIGVWTAQVKFDNAAYYAGTVAQLDLYTRMTVSFNGCFDVGDLIQFTVDTDLIS